MYLLNLSYTQKLPQVELHNVGHSTWVKKYRTDGTFLFASPKKNGLGGVIGVKDMAKSDLLKILAEDTYVAADVGDYQIIEVDIKLSAAAYEAMKAE